jgi:protein phosphatase
MATDIVFDRMRKAAGHGERDRLALDIVKSLEDAGSSILAEAMSNRACRGMGTTATVAALVDDHLLLGQVGDSRAYILRGSRFVQVTRDQSLVNQLIEAGQLTEEEAENFEHSNIILQALGTADSVQVDLTYVKLYRGDLLMMCSDGLSGMVRDSELRELLGRITDPAEICRVLIEEANLAGGHDNISVIAVRFEGDGLEECNEAATGALKYLKYPLPNATDEDAKHSAQSRSLAYDETPSIEVHGEFEVDGDMDWEQLLHDRRMMPNEGAEEGSRTWLWVLAVAAVVLFYVYFLR